MAITAMTVCRWRMRLSVREAAGRCGVSMSTIWRWERTGSWPIGALHCLDPENYDENDEAIMRTVKVGR